MIFLTDPFPMYPAEDEVVIVWFTNEPGQANTVRYGDGLRYSVEATSTKLSRLEGVWKQEAKIPCLQANTPYQVISMAYEEKESSEIFSCSPRPTPGKPLKILLTSDHQNKPMVAANLQKVKETLGSVDAIFFAGDCVNIPDNKEEWFDAPGSFFRCFQGKASKPPYKGGALLQTAPLYPTIGNHEVFGACDFQNATPNHFNFQTYQEIFDLPKYYAATFGDVRLISLCAARMWRSPQLGVKGKYSEAPEDFENPDKWGWGDFIFEPIEKGSAQYAWLEKELKSEEFRKAKYKIVMLHNPLHSLGENAAPPFAYPVQKIEKDEDGKITAVHYSYPPEDDLLLRDIEPLLEKYGVQLVFNGHCHIWNRFLSPQGLHHLESSNVGNSYGSYHTTPRSTQPGSVGDPGGLLPCGQIPYISSNELTVFSILDTATGSIDSYYFDTTKPGSSVIHFDTFSLLCTPAEQSLLLSHDRP